MPTVICLGDSLFFLLSRKLNIEMLTYGLSVSLPIVLYGFQSWTLIQRRFNVSLTSPFLEICAFHISLYHLQCRAGWCNSSVLEVSGSNLCQVLGLREDFPIIRENFTILHCNVSGPPPCELRNNGHLRSLYML
jgi:hypothetical protein